MKIVKSLLFILSIFIITHKTHSLIIHNQRASDESAMEPYLVADDDNKPSSMDNSYPEQLPLRLNHRRSESAEKYFRWASKSQRPMEYLRGKRFWLFTKKDENGISHETVPSADTAPSSIGQGIWRSGIVGRRRR